MIGLANIQTRLATNLMTFQCVSQKMSEDSNAGNVKNIFGTNQFYKNPSRAIIDIEMDAYAEATADTSYYSMKFILEDRKYEKKLLLNSPANALQIMDYYNRTGDTKIYWDRNSTGIPSNSPATEFLAADYLKIRDIGTTYWNDTGHLTDVYCMVYFSFDLTDYIAAYGADSIDRLTLMLHNPYFNQNNTFDGYKVFAFAKRDTGYSLHTNNWEELGQQTLSISDVDLRATSKMNQVFYSICKRKDFGKMAYYIADGFTFPDNTVNFCMYNSNPGDISTNFDLGFNYAGLIINGLGVRQISSDNFTYAQPYTGYGMTASLKFAEV